MNKRVLSLLALGLMVGCVEDKESDAESGDVDPTEVGDDDGGGSGDEGGGSGDEGGDEGGGDEGGGDEGGGDDGGDLAWPSGDPTGCTVEGQTFLLDLAGANFVEPAGVGSLIGGMLTAEIAVLVDSQDSSSMDIEIGLMEGGSQDMCVETQPLAGVSWADPVLSFGPTDLAMDVSGVSVVLGGFNFAAAVTEDCGALDQGVLVSELDMREMGDVFEDLVGTSDPSAICSLVASFGVSCEPCSTDGEPVCLPLAADQIEGPEGPALVPVTAADIADNPDCR